MSLLRVALFLPRLYSCASLTPPLSLCFKGSFNGHLPALSWLCAGRDPRAALGAVGSTCSQAMLCPGAAAVASRLGVGGGEAGVLNDSVSAFSRLGEVLAQAL